MSRARNAAPQQLVDRPAAGRRGGGPHLGPVRLTPLRATLVLALAGGLGFLGWSVFARDQLQVPMMATGFAICGIVLLLTGMLSLSAVVRAGRESRDAAAVMTALAGGLVTAAALLMLAGAVIMSLIWGGTKGA